jgi:hypothetical protein
LLGIVSFKQFSWGSYEKPEAVKIQALSSGMKSLPDSAVNIPVKISIDYMENIANKNTPYRFNPDWTKKDMTDAVVNDKYRYDITRGDIKLSDSGDKISFSCPFSGSASVGGDVRFIFKKWIEETIENINGTVTGTVGISLDPQWNVIPDISFDLHLSKAEGKLPLGIKYSIRTFLTDIFRDNIHGIHKAVSQTIVNEIKKITAESWTKFHMVQQISDSPQTWLKTEPSSIGLAPIKITENQFINSTISISAKVNVIADKKAPVNAVSSLPPLNVSQNESNAFSFYLPATIAVDELNFFLKKKFSETKISLSKNEAVTVTDPSLKTDGNTIIVSFSFYGSEGFFSKTVKGNMSLLGQLSYDQAKDTLRITDLDYDVSTKNILMKLADWLLKPVFLSKMEEALMIYPKQELPKLKELAYDFIKKVQLPAEINANLKIKSIDLHDIAVLGDHLYFALSAQGQSTVEIK